MIKVLICTLLFFVLYTNGQKFGNSYVYDSGRPGQALGQLAAQGADALFSCGLAHKDRKCFHNNWKKRDEYCSGDLWSRRFSTGTWMGGTCYCCWARGVNVASKGKCFGNNWKKRDDYCKGELWNKRYSNSAGKNKRNYCC